MQPAPHREPPTKKKRRRVLAAVAIGLIVAGAGVVATIAFTGTDPPELSPDRRQWNADTPGAASQNGSPATAPPGSFITAGQRLGIGRCPLFPRDNAFHADISTLPAAPDSQKVVEAAGASLHLQPGFSSVLWEGSRTGIPINVVDSTKVPSVDVVGGKYAYLSDLDNHPIPKSPRLEGYPGAAWDRHMLIVDTHTCTSHEFFYAKKVPVVGKWHVETAVTFDLNSNAIRERGSATAAGVSMLAGMIRYDELKRGRIDHVMSISLPRISTRPPVWPASGTDGRSDDPDTPPMGTWFRLRKDVDLSSLKPDALVVAKALQIHGAIVGDTGPEWMGLAGENDDRWNDAQLETLKTLTLSDFEVVDPSSMMISPDSYQIR